MAKGLDKVWNSRYNCKNMYHMIQYLGIMMSQTTAQSMFLFSGIDHLHVQALLKDDRLYQKSYTKGQEIYQTGCYTPCLCLILQGSVRIEKRTDQKRVPLRQMGKGDVFGAASLFGGEDYVTAIVAKSKTDILFFPQEYVKELVLSEPLCAMNYIAFLSEKVRYLNGKIDFFTAGSTKAKVYEYLVRAADERGNAAPTVSIKRLAEQLDMGRASLYRALDALSQEGKIEKTETGFRIIEKV